MGEASSGRGGLAEGSGRMADEGGDGVEVRDDAPNPMVLMTDVVDKLKILGYEEFAQDRLNGRLLHAAYFVVPHPKPNEQFHYFVTIFAFLMKKNSFSFSVPDEFDDPNSTVANIMEALRRARITLDYSQAKLRAGYGEAVCVLLNLLCDNALAKEGFRMPTSMQYPDSVYPEEAPVDDDEVSADIADTVAVVDDDDDDDDYQSSRAEAKKEETKETRIIESSINPNDWKVEVEKVAPLLKMRLEQDNKEWRTHLEHTMELQAAIQEKEPETKKELESVAQKIQDSIVAIQNRERTMNSQYTNEVKEYQNVKEKLTEGLQKFDERRNAVQMLESDLERIKQELETIKSQSDERGESMTDTSPLTRLKEAMKKIKKEIKEMDLRIGTVNHSLLHIKLANTGEKKLMRADDDDDDDD